MLFFSQFNADENRIMIRITEHGFIKSALESPRIEVVGIEVVRCYHFHLFGHARRCKNTIKVAHAAVINIGIALGCMLHEHIVVARLNEGLEGLFLGVAIVVAYKQDICVLEEVVVLDVLKHAEQRIYIAHTLLI